MIIALIAVLAIGVIGLAALFISKNGKEDVPTGKEESKKEQKEDTKVWLFDFSNYKGESLDPNAYLSVDVVEGVNYTFSFDYCVVGETINTSVINAAQAWGLGSDVEFPDGKLQGKGSYSVSFTADWPYLYPVFQTHMPMGAPKLYVWNLKLMKEGDDRNMLGYVTLNHFKGDLAIEGLISLVDIDPDTLEGTVVEVPEDPVWKLDFNGYKGDNQDPGAHISANVEKGAKYTFSFDYCVVGETLGLSVINAARDWGMGSQVAFTNNKLQGKGTYTVTFTADYPKIYPVFQCHIPRGRAELYLWNISLVKEGSDRNLFDKLILKSFGGELAEQELITLEDIDPAVLKGTTVKTYDNPMWLFDFAGYKGTEKDPNAYMSADVEKGKTYTFSFDYCLEGESLGTKVINAARDWGMGSKVEFTNNLLAGKGTYTVTFTADYEKIYPVFQTHMPYGAGKLYVWNMKLVKSGDNTNLIKTMTEKTFQGTLVNAKLASIVNVNPATLKGTKVQTYENPIWLFDFAAYKGSEKDPNAFITASVEKGSTYTFSFDYCVDGESLGTKVINAAQAWGTGSKVKFTNNQLTGKGTYKITFKADSDQVIPAFETHMPYGGAKLYVWNMKLVKSGDSRNVFGQMSEKSFKGTLVDAKLASIVDIDTDSLVGTTPKPTENIGGKTWLLDFSQYQGTNNDPNTLFTIDVEKGSTYTFSFDYCVDGESSGTKVINAAQAWGMGSNVTFTDNLLIGKGTYTITFKADTEQVIPVFQTHVPYGTPKLYVWNAKLVKQGSSTNILDSTPSSKMKGDLVDAGLVSVSNVDTDSLQPPTKPITYIGGNTWLVDYAEYEGQSLDPNVFFTMDIEKDAKYTFSFKYCVIGKSTGTKVVNAAQAWGLGSNVVFENNVLTGKGEYTTTFTADFGQVIPVFQTHTPYGTPELYVWDIQLVKDGTTQNMLADAPSAKLKGDLVDAGLVTVSDVNTDSLQPTEDEEEEDQTNKNVWKFDFKNYTGTEANPGAYSTVAIEKGKEYTFSFGYCVNGATTGTSVINAKQAWGLGSAVEFTNSKLTGKGTYTITFTADTTEVIPVFQTNVSKGTPELFVWDMKLVQTGSETNLMADKTLDDFRGVMKNDSLITITKMDPSTLEPSDDLDPVTDKNVWKFDFAGYTGTSTDPNAYTTLTVESGAEYTFSFEYHVLGSGTPKLINAAKDWQGASQVAFANNALTGKGTYTFTFTADHTQIIPVIQAHIPNGAPELYVWDMKLVKTGTETNLLADVTIDNFRGDLKNGSLITISEMDPSTLVPTPVVKKNVWLFDFASYKGPNATPNALTTLTVERGAEYTLSFEYHVLGDGTPKLINAAKEWQGASQVSFANNALTGKGTYTYTFTADHTQIIPVFQTHVPFGAPKLYVWDMKLVKTGSETNLLKDIAIDNYRGDLKNASLITRTEMDPNKIGTSN